MCLPPALRSQALRCESEVMVVNVPHVSTVTGSSFLRSVTFRGEAVAPDGVFLAVS